MKKLLALVLALVMTLSLATVSTNAAYEDAADISYVEAAEVMSELGVFVGDGKNFAPKAALNREQAAKLVAYLALGEDVAEALPAVSMFDDVAASSWAAKYIAYCADAGIITGDGAGKFYPANPVDGYAFAKMLLCALGYNAQAEGYVGGSWSINVARDAKALDLTKGFKGDISKNLTREEAAQLMLRAIQCQVVDKYEGAGSSITIGDLTISGDYGTAHKAGYYYATEFDVAVSFTESAQYTKYGQKARTWNVGTWSGTYALEDAKFVFTAETTAKAMAAALKGYYVGAKAYKVGNDVDVNKYPGAASVSVFSATNGVTGTTTFNFSAETTAKELADLTANGKVVELYAGSDMIIDQIIVKNAQILKVEDITVDTKLDKTSYKFETTGGSSVGATYVCGDDVETETIVVNGTVAEGDVVTVVAYGATGSKVEVYPTTKKVGALTSYNSDTEAYTVAGDAVLKNVACGALALDSDDNNYYFDQYGFVVYTDAVTATAQYAYIVAAHGKTTTTVDGTVPSMQVKAVLSDGTVGVYDVKITKKSDGSYYYAGRDTSAAGVETDDTAYYLNNTFKYELAGSTITLTAVNTEYAANKTVVAYISESDTDAGVYNKDNDVVIVYGAGSDVALMNSKTAYVFYDEDKGTSKVFTGNTAFDGYAFDYSAKNDVVVSVDEDGQAFAKVFFVVDYVTTTNKVDTFGYVDADKFVETKDADGTSFYAYTLTLTDGTTITVTAEADKLDNDGLYTYNTDKSIDDSNDKTGTEQYRFTSAANLVENLLEVNSAYYNVTADTKVVDCSSTYDKMDDASVIVWLVKKDGVVTKDIEAVFIVG